MNLNPNYIFYTIQEQLKLEELSNDAIAEIISSFFIDEELENSTAILNLALKKVTELKEGQKAWAKREEAKYQDDTRCRYRRLKLDGNSVMGFVPDDIEF